MGFCLSVLFLAHIFLLHLQYLHSFLSRFVILKLVPRDHVDQLPVPKRIKDYLKTPNYYSENITEEEEDEEKPIDESTTPEDYAAAM